MKGAPKEKCDTCNTAHTGPCNPAHVILELRRMKSEVVTWRSEYDVLKRDRERHIANSKENHALYLTEKRSRSVAESQLSNMRMMLHDDIRHRIATFAARGTKWNKGEEGRGLYQKYTVSKADGSGVDPNALYMVLRYDNDPLAREALRTLAFAVACVNTTFASDLMGQLRRHEGASLGNYSDRVAMSESEANGRTERLLMEVYNVKVAMKEGEAQKPSEKETDPVA